MHAYIHTYIHTYTGTYIRKHIHIYIPHASIQPSIHTYIQAREREREREKEREREREGEKDCWVAVEPKGRDSILHGGPPDISLCKLEYIIQLRRRRHLYCVRVTAYDPSSIACIFADAS